jgi:hypothetical protein
VWCGRFSCHTLLFIPPHVGPGDFERIALLYGFMGIEEEHGIQEPRFNGRTFADDLLDSRLLVHDGEDLELFYGKKGLQNSLFAGFQLADELP